PLFTGGTTGVGDGGGRVATLAFSGRSGPRGASFVLELPCAAELKGRVYDAAGREVARLVDGPSPAGVHTFAINHSGSAVRGLASGVYFAQIGITGGGANEVRMARAVVPR
ncbi:MAG: hypothetical protein ABIS67_02570, partial [Candidatus Eisenbacteria bacterium]